MRTLAFVDTNVPIYAAGKPHPLKQPCAEILSLISENPQSFITSAEVLQELLHRYASSSAWTSHGKLLLEAFSELMEDRIAAVEAADVLNAAELAGIGSKVSARDLLHVAVMQRVGADLIVSTDCGFDEFTQVRRLDPAQLPTWRTHIHAIPEPPAE